MTRLMGGLDLWVPYHGEPFGERIVRQEFAEIGRPELEADQAVRDIGKEVVADPGLQHPQMAPGSGIPLKHSVVDTRTAQPSGGPTLSPSDLETRRLVDRVALTQEALERAELISRHRRAARAASEDPDKEE